MCRSSGLKLLGVVLFLLGSVLADGLVVQEVVRYVADRLLQAFLEFLEIFLV